MNPANYEKCDSESPSDSSSHFPFLNLPLELRNEVYSYILPDAFEPKDEYSYSPVPFSPVPFSPVSPQCHYGSGSPAYSPTLPMALDQTSPTEGDTPWAPSSPCDPGDSSPYFPASPIEISGPGNTAGSSPAGWPPEPVTQAPEYTSDLLTGPPAAKSPLSILYVNKQIHDETTQLLYSKSAFTITIKLFEPIVYVKRASRGAPLTGAIDCTFLVQYISPWELLTYEYSTSTDSSTVTYLPESHPIGDDYKLDLLKEKSQNLQEPDLVFYPAQRYRHLLRDIRINIIDHWRTERMIWSSDSHDPLDPALKVLTVFSPILWRLREVLTDKAAIQLTVTTLFRSYPRNFPAPRQPRNEECLIRQVYSSMLESAFLLTCGPWKYSLKLPDDIIRKFPDVGLEVFAKCNNQKLDEAALQELFRIFEISSRGET